MMFETICGPGGGESSRLTGTPVGKLLQSLARDESGASLVEYSILIGIVTAGVVAIITAMAPKVGGPWFCIDGLWGGELDAAGQAVCQPTSSP